MSGTTPPDDESGIGYTEDLASVVPVEPDDDLAAVCGRVDQAPSYAVVVHAPRGNRELSSELGMRRLIHHAEDSGKALAIATRSWSLAGRARSTRVPVARKPESVRWDSGGHRVLRIRGWSTRLPRVGGYFQLFVFFAIFGILGGLGLTMAPAAEVTVVPPMRTFTETFSATVSLEQDTVDIEARTLPGHRVSASRTITVAVPVTGRETLSATSATATVSLRNTGSAAITIPAGAILLAGEDGLPFALAVAVTVPGGQTVSAQVAALDPGPAGNVAAGAITRWEQPSYTAIAATNAGPASGGDAVQRTRVSQEDVDAALAQIDALTASTELAASVLARFRDDGLLLRTAEATAEHSAPEAWLGSSADLILLDVTVTVTAVAVPHVALEDLARRLFTDRPDGVAYIPGSVTAVETGATSGTSDDGNYLAEFAIAGSFATGLTEDEVLAAVRGQSRADAESILWERYGIEEQHVDLSPGWAPWLPRFDFRIDVHFRTTIEEPDDADGTPTSDAAPAGA